MSAFTAPPPESAQGVDSLIGANFRKRVFNPPDDTDQQMHLWFVLAGLFEGIQTTFDHDESAKFSPDIRALLTGTLALGENLLNKMPNRRDIQLIQENIRSRYDAWYGSMSDAAADHILGEAFGVS
jgi:hypothetical protein